MLMTVHLTEKMAVTIFDWLRLVLQRPRNGPRNESFQPQTFTTGFSHKREAAAYVCRRKVKIPFRCPQPRAAVMAAGQSFDTVMNAVKGSISPNGTRVSFPTYCLVQESVNERPSFLSIQMNPFPSCEKSLAASGPRYEPATGF
jgi:hypothetical protein